MTEEWHTHVQVGGGVTSWTELRAILLRKGQREPPAAPTHCGWGLGASSHLLELIQPHFVEPGEIVLTFILPQHLCLRKEGPLPLEDRTCHSGQY